MITKRPARERGIGRASWLDSRHSFSFADYYDPAHMGFRSLRVINEDMIAPGGGFATHGHRDMEILTYVLDGALAHRDSIGNGSTIRPREVQLMHAGTGIQHSEFNASKTEPVHLLQIWILPEREGATPGYQQKAFPPAEMADRLRLVASHDGGDGSLVIHQDAAVYAGNIRPGGKLDHALAPGRHGWVQVAGGALVLNGVSLAAGDGAAVTGETKLSFEASEDSEILFFDLA
ncbi:MAG TPA: pirin family protein [Rhodospirillales bacterium]